MKERLSTVRQTGATAYEPRPLRAAEAPRRRVLLISPHFPPDSSAGTHRVRLLAPHLATYGWEPTILTVEPGDGDGYPDHDLERSVPAALRVVRVRAWSRRITRLAGIGDLGLRSYVPLRVGAARLLSAEQFDALFITIYPAYTAILGPWLKRRFGVPFVLDYQDPWVGEWGRSVGPGAGGRPDLRSRLSRALARRLEPAALAAADGVVAVSRSTFAQALARNPDARPTVTDEIPIGWDAADVEFARSLPPNRTWWPAGDGLLHVSYVGTLLPTGVETLRALLTAVARLQPTDRAHRLRFHFFGTSNRRSPDAEPRVLPIARELGVDAIITEIPRRLDYFDALRVLGESSAVLVLGSREPHYTPSKVFPALLSRRPVIAACHEASSAAALLRTAGGSPAIQLITYSEASPAMAHVDKIMAAFDNLSTVAGRDVEVPAAALDPFAADALAGRLAAVLDRVTDAARPLVLAS